MEAAVIYSAKLYSCSDSQEIESQIYTDLHSQFIPLIQQQWQPLLFSQAKSLLIDSKGNSLVGPAAKQQLSKFGIADFHWKWDEIVNAQETGFTKKTFYLVHNGSVQGALHAKFPKISWLDTNSRLVYVDFIAIAPWNRDNFGNSPLYRGVGGSLMLHVMNYSFNQGYLGLIGLHSLHQAEGFYERLGMSKLGYDATYGNMAYFELPLSLAQQYTGD